MLLHLHIRNFAIVPALAQDFEPGFTAISGETGAGKSILVDALSLLLGARSDSGWVKSGADKAELTAEFSLADNPEARAWLAELDLQDGDNCLLRRTIAANGRSRAWVNGSPVTVQQLGGLGDLLVELHGQNEHIRLTGSRRQRELLDATGGYAKALSRTADACAHWQALEQRFQDQAQAAAMSPGEFEYLQFQYQELEATAQSPESLHALEQEHRLLAGSGSLLEALEQAGGLIEADDRGLSSGLSTALTLLAPFRPLDPEIDQAGQMLEEARINTDEALASLRAARQRVDLSPERLAQVEAQLSELNSLARKHQVPMEDLPAVRDDLQRRLEAAGQFEERREALESERDQALADYRKAAASLSKRRRGHAETLAGSVQKLMGSLGMAGGAFVIPVEHDADGAPSASGNDRVSIQVSANPGVPPAPLSKVASGGELSRISLAIKVSTSGASLGRTQVFDEVDAGIGGDTANAVGGLLQNLASGGQALCVTHLAQVAVCADQQLLVQKQADAVATDVDALLLDTPARVEEIARMLGGKVSAQSRAHAEEMLAAAQKAAA